MSTDAGAFLRVQLSEGMSSMDVLAALISGGWVLDDLGSITYLPPGDEDFDWTSRGHDALDLVERDLQQRVRQGEVLGVVLTLRETDIGGTFLFYSDGRVIFSPIVNRVLRADGSTDADWYLSRLLPPVRARVPVQEVRWSESA